MVNCMLYELYHEKKSVDNKIKSKKKKKNQSHSLDFPGGPVTKTLSLQCRGLGVQSLIREPGPTGCN